jgi:NADPH:quinone reductase-like Zn-dependent oxidoreductase
MRAWQVEVSDGRSQLRAVDMDEPTPAQGEVVVRVRAAGVTPTELLWYPTTHTSTGATRLHAVPGHEFAGVVAAVGAGVGGGVAVGQEVFGMNDWFADGATAEFCVTRPEWIAPKPARLSFAEAASAPIGALTAWQGLFDRAKLQRGETVLIHGASGGVGVFAVQLAHRHGAKVIATASAAAREFLTALGTDRVIDYRGERFEDVVRDVDVVFDGVGGSTLQRSWSVLRPSGRLVTIAADSEGAADERIKRAFFIVELNGGQLRAISALLDVGELRAFVQGEVPMSQADSAYAGAMSRGPTRGKLVVVL